MSSTCIISIKNENWMKREILLYQHTDGHPNSMLLPLVEELRDIYNEFNDIGDTDWFMDPAKLSGFLIVRSVPKMTDDMMKLVKSLPAHTKSRLESNLYLGIPSLFPDVVKASGCNYEYSIILKESIEENFFGYTLDVYKLQNNKRVSTILSNVENYLKTPTKLQTKEKVLVDNE